MNRRYFGTDGIRGRVGEAPITPDFMLKLGWACGRVFNRQLGLGGAGGADAGGADAGGNNSSDNNGASAEGGCTVIIGKDTRVSGYMLESALEAGLVAAGVNVKLLGPMPTPAIALMTRTQSAAAGIVISASHNPFSDNGIKFFNSDGRKLDDAVELAIEAQLNEPLHTVSSNAIGKVARVVDAAGRYIEYCKSTVPDGFSLRDLKLVVDCAHGAAYHIAPSVFAELGADVVPLGVEPDGFNINRGVGSTDTAALSQRVVAESADVGVALDGDGDRVIFVDRRGGVVDGDELLFIIACHRAAQQGCEGVVGTQMTNLGVERALGEQSIGFARAQVGDRYVNELMLEKGWPLGGEESGHIICADYTTTGDGIVAALQVLVAMRAQGQGLDVLRGKVSKYPQCMINVAAAEPGRPGGADSDRPPVAATANSGSPAADSDRLLVADPDRPTTAATAGVLEHPEITAAVAEMEAALGDSGRVLLRASGTEPVVRVMVEGQDKQQVETLCQQLADKVREVLAH